MKNMDEFNRAWIIERAVPIVNSYNNDITLRSLHYRLVSLHHFPNTIRHYKRVIGAMTVARWEGLLDFDQFVDHDREKLGSTAYEETILEDQIETGKEAIKNWMELYYKNRWENQDTYLEVWIEKKALISAFQRPCQHAMVALCPCKGYPSLTFLNEARGRFNEAISNGKNPVMLYFGDYDPSGEDIPRSIDDTLSRMGCDITVERIALMEDQVIEMGLPPAPTKSGDSRTAKWDGIGQVELDAIEPGELKKMTTDAINKYFDQEKHLTLKHQEEGERGEYKSALKDFVDNL